MGTHGPSIHPSTTPGPRDFSTSKTSCVNQFNQHQMGPTPGSGSLRVSLCRTFRTQIVFNLIGHRPPSHPDRAVLLVLLRGAEAHFMAILHHAISHHESRMCMPTRLNAPCTRLRHCTDVSIL